MVSAVSGDVGGSAKKVGKRIKKLERIYGIYKMLADMIPELSPHKKDTAGKLSIGALCFCVYYNSISAKSI